MDNVLALPKKRSLLPVLIILFVISYGLMTVLIVEQARTIDAQRSLIRTLFSDSVELTSMKGKAFQKQRAEAQAQAKAQSEGQSNAQAPSSQSKPQDHGKIKNEANKLRKPAPQKPPRPASDLADERRALISI